MLNLLNSLHRGARSLPSVPTLLGLALASEIVWIGVFLLRFPVWRYYRQDTDMGAITGHSVPAFWEFIAAFAVLFALFGVALAIGSRLSGRGALWCVLGAGAAMGSTLSFVYPITAVDVFTYIAQSRILLYYHQNPVVVVPASYPGDQIMKMTDGWSGTGAPYGPIGILIDALPSLPAQGNLLLTLILTKLFFTLLALIAAYLAWQILRPVSNATALTGALFIAWNPLILFETSVNGHNDVVMMVLLLLALDSVVSRDLVAATVLIVGSALVKYGTGVLLPLFLVHALANSTNRLRYLVTAGALSGALLILAYLPFWDGPETLTRTLLENSFHFESFGSVLVTFFPIGIDPATAIGRVLYLPVYLYALYRARGSVFELIQSCFWALLGFLGLASANFRIWYALWPNFLAAAGTNGRSRLAAALMGLGATLSATFYGFLWVWDNLRDFAMVNDLGYVVTFGPPVLVFVFYWVRAGSRPAVRWNSRVDRSEATQSG